MSSRLAARTAVVCTLFFQVAIAWAQPAAEDAPRRAVGVIDLTDTKEGEDLAKVLGNELNNHKQLKPIDDQSLFAELIGTVEDEDAAPLEDARKSMASAEQQLAQFSFVNAANSAIAGQDRLAHATPKPAVIAVYAELAFVLGQARLGERKPELAASAFALAHRLNPSFTPDAARYLPEIVQAFEAAKIANLGTGSIRVTGTGRVSIDGAEVGNLLPPPSGSTVRPTATFDVIAGPHVVWLTGAERDPRAKQVNVIAQQKEQADIDDAPTGLPTRVRRARLALKLAPDASARATLMKQLATLLKVSDAIILTSMNGKTMVQTWRDRAPGFSPSRERKNEKPIALLAPLAPPLVAKVQPKIEDPVVPKLPIVEKRWYQRRTWRAGMVATGVAVVAGFFAVRSIDRTVPLDFRPGFQTTGTAAK